MRAHVRWTKELDERLMALRRDRVTWDGIAAAMGLGRNTVLERGRKIGARRMPKAAPSVQEERLDRPPRPAGHPLTWGLINEGTVLEGEAYPYPVFL
jgi:hypothetical protein